MHHQHHEDSCTKSSCNRLRDAGDAARLCIIRKTVRSRSESTVFFVSSSVSSARLSSSMFRLRKILQFASSGSDTRKAASMDIFAAISRFICTWTSAISRFLRFFKRSLRWEKRKPKGSAKKSKICCFPLRSFPSRHAAPVRILALRRCIHPSRNAAPVRILALRRCVWRNFFPTVCAV